MECKDVRTTMVYTHVLNRDGRGGRSPADGPRNGLSRNESRGHKAINSYNTTYGNQPSAR
jgi:hypothetical protein